MGRCSLGMNWFDSWIECDVICVFLFCFRKVTVRSEIRKVAPHKAERTHRWASQLQKRNVYEDVSCVHRRVFLSNTSSFCQQNFVFITFF